MLTRSPPPRSEAPPAARRRPVNQYAPPVPPAAMQPLSPLDSPPPARATAPPHASPVTPLQDAAAAAPAVGVPGDLSIGPSAAAAAGGAVDTVVLGPVAAAVAAQHALSAQQLREYYCDVEMRAEKLRLGQRGIIVWELIKRSWAFVNEERARALDVVPDCLAETYFRSVVVSFADRWLERPGNDDRELLAEAVNGAVLQLLSWDAGATEFAPPG
jgi:hypothetical protein